MGAAVLHGAIVGTSDALGVPYLVMQGVATVTVMFLTYEINRRWTFAARTD
jgi:putative flippase GtrA